MRVPRDPWQDMKVRRLLPVPAPLEVVYWEDADDDDPTYARLPVVAIAWVDLLDYGDRQDFVYLEAGPERAVPAGTTHPDLGWYVEPSSSARPTDRREIAA